MDIEIKNKAAFYIHLFAWGDVYHGNGDFDVDREFYKKLKKSFDYLVNSDDRPPQYPPIKRNHSDDGFVYGFIKEIFSTDENQVPGNFTSDGIYALVYPGPRMAVWREDGLLGDWSPGIAMKWTDPHTGDELENVLLETSFVSEGHLRNTEKDRSMYSLSAAGLIQIKEEQKMGEKEKETEMEYDEKKEMQDGDAERLDRLEKEMASLKDGMESLAGQVGRLVAAMEGNDDDSTDLEDEKHSMSARIKELEERVLMETQKRVKTEALQTLTAKGIQLEEKERDAIIQLSVDKPEAFEATIHVLSKNVKPKENNVYNFGETGVVGDSGGDQSSGVHKMCAQLKECGKSRREAYKELTKNKLVNLMDEKSVSRAHGILDEFYPR